MMRTFYTMMLIFAFVLVGCESETATDAAPETLQTDTEKVSYGLGRNIGMGISQQNIPDLDLAALAAGIGDAIDGSEAKVSDSELQAAYLRIQEALRKEAEALEQEFLTTNGAREGVITTDSGLQYEVLKSGDGDTPGPESRVKTHYLGTLMDGSVFDSSFDRGQPAELGVDQVIAGWTEALQLMKVGDKWKIYVPANLGYGEYSPGPDIPRYSTLIFELELLDILEEEDEVDDGADEIEDIEDVDAAVDE